MIGLWLPLPPTGNLYHRTVVARGRTRYYRSPAVDGYAMNVHARFLELYRQTPVYPAGTRLAFRFLWALPPKRAGRGDLDNRLKVLQDVLQGLAYERDSQIDLVIASRVKSPELTARTGLLPCWVEIGLIEELNDNATRITQQAEDAVWVPGTAGSPVGRVVSRRLG